MCDAQSTVVFSLSFAERSGGRRVGWHYHHHFHVRSLRLGGLRDWAAKACLLACCSLLPRTGEAVPQAEVAASTAADWLVTQSSPDPAPPEPWG